MSGFGGQGERQEAGKLKAETNGLELHAPFSLSDSPAPLFSALILGQPLQMAWDLEGILPEMILGRLPDSHMDVTQSTGTACR